MSATITFDDAIREKKIQPGHYFLVTVPKDRSVTITESETGCGKQQKFQISAGEQKLWRLEKGIKMWGEPTKELLTLNGENGFINGLNAIKKVASEIYGLPEIFENVQACSFPQMEYFFHEIPKVLEEVGKTHITSKDKRLNYWIASRCVTLHNGSVDFCIFRVYNGDVSPYSVYNSNRGPVSNTYAVRPEATPNATLLFETDGLDGSKKNPWKVLSK